MLACIIAYLCLFASIAVGSMALAEQPLSPVVVAAETPVKKLTEVKLEPSLIGGRIADDGELPFSVFLLIGNNTRCTGSVVGPEVLLTAGHCLGGARDSVSFNIDGRNRRGTCTRHPQFQQQSGGNINNDFAMCTFSPRVNDESLFAEFETGNVSVNDRVTLQGFGQNRVGTLQIGDARIVQVDNRDLVTNSNVRLGGGDSGGGLLLGTPNTRRGPFLIVGVNSRVGGNFSFFNRINLARSLDFFEQFLRDNRTEACGLNRECRGGNTGAQCDSEQDVVDFFKGELDDAERLLDQCLRGR